MFSLLMLVITVSLFISFLCSLMEAALLTVPEGKVQSLVDQNKKGSHRLLQFKKDIGSPISAILILNTISHTLGATFSGALVDKIYGDQALVWFSIIFTFLILYFSEIIPKQIGAVFYTKISLWISTPLQWLIILFYPMIITTNWVAGLIKKSSKEPLFSVQEILAMTKISGKEGILDTLESAVIRNIILLDRITVNQVFTQKAVVFRMPDNTPLEEIRQKIADWNFTRIPLFEADDEGDWHSYVHQRDLLRDLLNQETDKTLSDYRRPLKSVRSDTPLDKVFVSMMKSRETIRSVVNSKGEYTGIVTLEDILEEIVGNEIMDEYDFTSNLRAQAQALAYQKNRISKRP